MRFPTRFSPALLAMAFAAPLSATAVAQQAGGYTPPAPITLDQAPSEGYQQGMEAVAPAPAPAPKHNHKGLFGWRRCVECQRARAKADTGFDVPPPPASVPQGQTAQHAHNHNHDHAVASTGCAACDAGAVVVGPITVTETETEAYPAGRAVSNGEMTASNMPAGRAVVGPDPAPVGLSRSSQGNLTPFNALAAGGPPNGPRDPSVMPTSMIPPQTAVSGQVGGRPRIISHLLGLPDLRRLRQDTSAYKSREGHAAISYENGVGPVTELPASVVYGKDAH